jgi:hypothetical protein
MTDALTQIQSDLAALTAAGSPFGQAATLTDADGGTQAVRMVCLPAAVRRDEGPAGAADWRQSSALITGFTTAPRCGDTLTDEAGFAWQIVGLRNHLAGGLMALLAADTQTHRHDSGYRTRLHDA